VYKNISKMPVHVFVERALELQRKDWLLRSQEAASLDPDLPTPAALKYLVTQLHNDGDAWELSNEAVSVRLNGIAVNPSDAASIGPIPRAMPLVLQGHMIHTSKQVSYNARLVLWDDGAAHECGCKGYDAKGIPCVHTPLLIAAAHNQGLLPERFAEPTNQGRLYHETWLGRFYQRQYAPPARPRSEHVFAPHLYDATQSCPQRVVNSRTKRAKTNA
jgi:hypothetical protein